MKNSQKTHAAMIRIFEVNVKTLTSFIRRETKQNEGQNKTLTKHEEDAVDDFIRSLLTYNISSTREIIYNAIIDLKKSNDCNASSKR
jgi:hypothetical protein